MGLNVVGVFICFTDFECFEEFLMGVGCFVWEERRE